jgi:hypothetical protein
MVHTGIVSWWGRANVGLAKIGLQPILSKERKPGYRIPERTARISFSGTDYDGAEIEVRLSVTFGQFIGLRAAAQGEDQEGMARLFGDNVLMTWNLEDNNGDPIPANGDGMLAIPLSLTNLVVQHWVEQVAGVPDPLSVPSGDLSTLAAASTGMETG